MVSNIIFSRSASPFIISAANLLDSSRRRSFSRVSLWFSSRRLRSSYRSSSIAGSCLRLHEVVVEVPDGLVGIEENFEIWIWVDIRLNFFGSMRAVPFDKVRFFFLFCPIVQSHFEKNAGQPPDSHPWSDRIQLSDERVFDCLEVHLLVLFYSGPVGGEFYRRLGVESLLRAGHRRWHCGGRPD